MWQKVMARVHEGYENKSFATPSGITSCSVCARSGKLPIPGLCDAHIHSEYYEEGTQPTEYCDVHFTGTVCAYSMLPACESCPFRAEGVFELPLPEDPSLQQGNEATFSSGNVDFTLGDDGIRRCMHNAVWMSDPNNQAIIDQQSWELSAAAQAAQMQAETAPETPQPEAPAE